MMWSYDPGMGGWVFALMTVGAVPFWIVRYLRTAGIRPQQVRPAPEELLAERFARGEIDEEDDQRRPDELHNRSGPQPVARAA